ncbi:Chromosome partition protein Smc [Shimia sp. SK013]|uniref:hypothetical protein n=1 Tax=Shimia sp. SK013 TaxID=1389006 RepID=UPI0006B5E845|nr:hypothetical protein [Shimia sp. SK013]KPA22321.1 Chromosome partition protein Smc [Shimia sp. SK013]
MSDISDLESRLSGALERIGRGVAKLGPASAAADAEVPAVQDMSEEVASLRRALEHEASASAQLEERLRAVTQKQDEVEAELSVAREAAEKAEAELAEAHEAADATVTEVADLRTTVDLDSAAGEEADERIEELSEKVAVLEGQLEVQTSARIAAEAAADSARNSLATAGAGDGEESLLANREAMEQMAQRLRRMRRMGKGVRENNERLRAAAEDKVVDVALINDALKAEIDSLKALREAEMAEADVILTGLAPMLSVANGTDAEATKEEDA